MRWRGDLDEEKGKVSFELIIPSTPVLAAVDPSGVERKPRNEEGYHELTDTGSDHGGDSD